MSTRTGAEKKQNKKDVKRMNRFKEALFSVPNFFAGNIFVLFV